MGMMGAGGAAPADGQSGEWSTQLVDNEFDVDNPLPPSVLS
jgi:hypothetical protein